MKHPTPWKVETGIYASVLNANGTTVLVFADDERELAELVVRRVNAHERLVDEMQLAMECAGEAAAELSVENMETVRGVLLGMAESLRMALVSVKPAPKE